MEVLSFFEELRHLAELVVATIRQSFGGLGAELRQVLLKHGREICRRRVIVVVSAAGWFGDHFIDDAQFDHVLRGYLKRLRGKVALAGVAPHDGGATFWSD